jgi:hypothetical protein
VNQAQFYQPGVNGPLLGTPIEATIGGLKYRLFRVRGVFKRISTSRTIRFDRHGSAVSQR